ncbi:MAG: uroporphyrinogen decarboxylase family protein [Anaerolineae bacterium]
MEIRGLTHQERVFTALRHQEGDRIPCDFLATAEVWDKMVQHFQPDTSGLEDMPWLEPEREAILRRLDVDCRLFSYDMFCNPPDEALKPGAQVDWWSTLARSTPNRMWRQVLPDGTLYDIWGAHFQVETHMFGQYEGLASWVLSQATTVDELKSHPWPTPDWWDFSELPAMIDRLQQDGPFHIRFRLGSFFEQAWALRGLEQFMLDIGMNPAIAEYIMDRILEVHLENLKTVLDLAGNRLDMVYTYDDVATQNSLLISPKSWRKLVKPRHRKILDVVHSYGIPAMYHCDGAVAPLIPELIDIGVDVLNPIQPDAKGMAPAELKEQYGGQLTFHGGVDIIRTLPRGSKAQVQHEVRERTRVLGRGGGYIMCSSHHVQPDTPLENVLAMYEPALREPCTVI